MSALRHWEQDRNAGVQFGSYSPLPLDSSQPNGNFQIQDDVRYMYQQPQQADATQFSGVFQTPAPDGDPWSFQMSMPRMNNFDERSVQQMRSPAPSLQSAWLASPMQEAAERQQIRSWMIHQLHNTPVGKSRGTIGNLMFAAIFSKTDHADRRPR